MIRVPGPGNENGKSDQVETVLAPDRVVVGDCRVDVLHVVQDVG